MNKRALPDLMAFSESRSILIDSRIKFAGF
jgi:hypothetical protein